MAKYNHTTTFSNAKLASAESYSLTGDSFVDGVAQLDVLSNDTSAPASATLFSIGYDATVTTQGAISVPTELLTAYNSGSTYLSQKGATISMVNGVVDYGSQYADTLAAGQLGTDVFDYAVQAGGGTISWNTVTLNLTGAAAYLQVYQDNGFVTEAQNWGLSPPENTTDKLTDGGAIVAYAASGDLTTITVKADAGDKGTLTFDTPFENGATTSLAAGGSLSLATGDTTFDSNVGTLGAHFHDNGQDAYHFAYSVPEDAVFLTGKGYGETAFTDSWTVTTANGTSGSFSETAYGSIHAPVYTGDTSVTLDEETTKTLTVSAGDHDDNAVLTYTVTGLPSDAYLTDTKDAAAQLTGGSIALTPDELSGLTLHAGEQVTTSLTVTVTNTESYTDTSSTDTAGFGLGTSTSTAGGVTVTYTTADTGGTDGSGSELYSHTAVVSTDTSLSLTVNPVADPAVLTGTLRTASGDEEGAIGLTIKAAAAESDQTVSSVAITGVPSDAMLSSAAHPGDVAYDSLTQTWTVMPDALADLKLDAGEQGSPTLHVVVTTADGSATNSAATADIAVTINPVAEAPVLHLGGTGVTVAEGGSVALPTIGAAGDLDDTISFTISGLPSGAYITDSLGDPQFNGGSDITLSQAQGQSTLTLHDGGSEAGYNLSVTANNTNPDEMAGSAAQTIAVTVTPDTPTASDGSVSGNENTAIPGTLSGADSDNDRTFVIDTNPAHGTLTAFDAATGAFTYTPASNFVGGDSFTFHTLDGSLAGTAATESVTVNSTDVEGTVSIAFGMNIGNLVSLEGTSKLNKNNSMGSMTASGDADDTFTYMLGGGTDGSGHTFDTGDFTLSSSGALATGAVDVSGGNTATLYLNVVATDSESNQTSQEFIVAIGNSSGNTMNFAGQNIPVIAYGLAGSDPITGGNAGIAMSGGSGNDVLVGGSGNDTLVGGAGVDMLTGGGGSDIFGYAAVGDSSPVTAGRNPVANFDTITDFLSGTDKIDLSAIAVTGNNGHYQNANFGTAAIVTGGTQIAADSIGWVTSGSDIDLYVNPTGSSQSLTGASIMQINLDGVSSLTEGDFLLGVHSFA